MSERFFLSEPIVASRIALAGDEARHLTSVMRAKVGDEVTLFDGSGAEFLARIAAIGKHTIELDITERRDVNRELPFELTLAVALPKGDRQKWLVEKATELGVTRIVPLVTARGVAQPVDAALERLRRGVIEASKQCRRNRLMEIAEPLTAATYVASVPQDSLRFWADPSGEPLSHGVPRFDPSHPLVVHCAIGPEGGFTPEETAAAQKAGWRLVSLGPRILRIETAALMLAAWIAASVPLPRQEE
jgi:16S rRNA (uracil1498-N3)-methyltransferase